MWIQYSHSLPCFSPSLKTLSLGRRHVRECRLASLMLVRRIPPPSSGPANTCYELPAAARRWRYGAGAQGRTDPKFERVFLFVCLFDAWAGVDWKDGKPTYLPLFYEFYAWKEGVLPPYPGSVFQDALCLQIVEFSPPKNVRCSQWTLGGWSLTHYYLDAW